MIKHTFQVLFVLFLFASFTSCASSDNKEMDTQTEETSEKKSSEEEVSYSINTEKSMVRWKGFIVSVYAHEGILKFESGNFKTKGGELVEGSFVVDMKTMVPTDDNFKPEEGKTKEGLVGHLASPDFFDVAKFPKSRLSIVDGHATMTVRGHAKGVELNNVKLDPNGDNISASAEFTFSRKAFGVDSSNLSDMAISDEITVRVDIDGTRN